MNWLLVVIVAGSPLVTDLRFSNYADCIAAEQQMRLEQTRRLNLSLEFLKPDEKTRAIWQAQVTPGACIPTK